LTTKTQTSTDNAPRAYLGTATELGALLSHQADPRIDPDMGNAFDHLMAAPRAVPDMETASRAERCTCGKPWDDCPLKALRGKLHPTNVAFRCRLIRVAREHLETQRRPWWRRLTRALTF
jgi:hypothetical protein